MLLYILRHAIAVEFGTQGYTNDDIRPLTPDGIRRMEQGASGMRAMGIKVDVVYASPLIRAAHTARIAAAAIGASDKVIETDVMAPDDGFGDRLTRESPIVQLLASRPARAAMVVGHEPDLSGLVSLLLTGSLAANVQFKKAALCAIDVGDPTDSRQNTLLWFLAPRQLRAIGRASDDS